MWVPKSISGKKSSQKKCFFPKSGEKFLCSFLPGGKDFKDKVGILKLISIDKYLHQMPKSINIRT